MHYDTTIHTTTTVGDVLVSLSYSDTSRTTIVRGSFAAVTKGRCGPLLSTRTINAILACFENVLRLIRALCALTTALFLSPGNRVSGTMLP